MADEWRLKLAAELLGDGGAAKASAFSPTGPTALEIAFGLARSEVTYVLELARAHAIPASGNVIGDEVWLRLGPAPLRFRMDRVGGIIHASVPGRGEDRIRWDERARSVSVAGRAGSGGPPVETVCDMKNYVRDAIDACVRQWKNAPGPTTISTSRELPAARSSPPPAAPKDK